MVVTMIPFAAFAAIAAETATGGDGNVFDADGKIIADPDWYDSTSKDHYVWDESDFLAFGANMVKAASNYKGQVIHIMADLDFNAADGTNAEWPAGYRNRTIYGIVDGHNHTIKGLTYSPQTGDYIGFFGGRFYATEAVNEVYGCASGVLNVRMEDCSIITGAAKIVGAIAGRAEEGNQVIFKNIYADVDIIGGTDLVGGICGWDLGTTTIFENCIYAGDMTLTGGSRVGGIVGSVRKNAAASTNATDIRDCLVTGNINVTCAADTAAAGAGVSVGGIVGGLSDKGGSNGDQPREGNLSIYFSTFAGKITTNAEYVGMAVGSCQADLNETTPVKGSLSVSHSNLIGELEITGEWTTNAVIVGKANSHDVSLEVCSYDPIFKVNGNDTARLLSDGEILKKDRDNVSLGTAGTSVTKYAGYQVTAAADGKVNVRFVSTVDSLAHENVGYDITYVISDYVKEDIDTVYTSILGGTKTYTATDLGGGYIFTAEYEGLEVDCGIVTFLVKTYHVDGGEKIWDDVQAIIIDTSALK